MNNRKTDSSGKAKRQKPAVIIITMIFALFMLVVTTRGCLRLIFDRAWGGLQDVSLLVWASALGQQLGMVSLAAAAFYACVKRPTWGRAVSMVFAVVFGMLIGFAQVSPDSHPAFPIAPGAEQAGAYTGQVLMALGTMVYVWSMVLGAKAKAYFVSSAQ